MRLAICVTVAAIVFAGSTAGIAKPAKHSPFQLNETTWTFTEKANGKVEESIDADGNYIAQTVAGKHLDHGRAVMKGSKACFTSKMTKESEECWTTRPIAIGHSFVATNNKGRKLRVTRIKYTPLEMPK